MVGLPEAGSVEGRRQSSRVGRKIESEGGGSDAGRFHQRANIVKAKGRRSVPGFNPPDAEIGRETVSARCLRN